jgi:hypothetical protein
MANQSQLIKPKWTLHDLNANPEHDLFQSYIVEFNDISGIEVDYYIRIEGVDTEIDHIYGEPLYQNTYWSTAHRTKLIYETTEEPSITDLFGTVSDDQIQFASMPKFTFYRDVNANAVDVTNVSAAPKAGDVIKTIWNDRAYEVVEVHEEIQVFQLNKQAYQFILKPFRFSEQGDSADSIAELTFEPTEFIDTSTESTPLTATYAHTDNTELENETIDKESDEIDDYSDVDTSIYGY